jgi:hypothetical protein
MNLIDGLNHFKKSEGPAWWQYTEDLEYRARQLLQLLSRYGPSPAQAALTFAYDLLVDIEKWKAMCMKERMVNAQQNPPHSIWAAYHGAVAARSDQDAILAVMSLKGFGASVDEVTGQRRAKVASAVLRFLMPETWGVVDWRTIAIRGILNKHHGDVDLAIADARRHRAADLREVYDQVDEHAACGEVSAYRSMRTDPPLSRAADIDMALFGLSEIVWPF